MDIKNVLKQVGKGMIIRRGASMIAHKKDPRPYIDKQTDFSPVEREQMKEKAAVIGEVIRRKTPVAPKPPSR